MLNVIGSVFPVACMLLTREEKKTSLKVLCFFPVCRPSKVEFDDCRLGFVRESRTQSARVKKTAYTKQKTSAIFPVGLVCGGKQS